MAGVRVEDEEATENRFAVKEQMAMGSPPERSSVALAVSVIQEVMYTWPDEVCSPRMLRLRLSAAVKDD